MIKKLLCSWLVVVTVITQAQTNISPTAYFNFNKTTGIKAKEVFTPIVSGTPAYTRSFAGNALQLQPATVNEIIIDKALLNFNTQQDYSVQFWVRTNVPSNYTMPLIGQKQAVNTGLSEQKKPGWLFYYAGGTWAFNIGTGKRRITNERDNGHIMPLNDGSWHQLTMTYNSKEAQLKLFYDGDIKAQYFLGDSVGFNLNEQTPFIIGAKKADSPDTLLQTTIQQGAVNLQKLVDAFNALGAGHVLDKDYMLLLTEPKKLYNDYLQIKPAAVKDADFTTINKVRSELMRNPYTVHQVIDFVEVAPVTQLYALQNGHIVINNDAMQKHIYSRTLHAPNFEIDELRIWNRTVEETEIQSAWTKYFISKTLRINKRIDSITVANWNIWHGGKHFTEAKDGFDSRKRIVEMIKKENADVVMLQETYSAGEFIAAELGYYYAASADWDYLNQGSNISVLSKYPITAVAVPALAPFMNLGAKIAVSKTQEIYIMSNWYGMNQFAAVYDFHKNRFAKTDSVPVIFAGDFNAVPAVDGGTENSASVTLTQTGFTDAYRQVFPNISTHPGFTHTIGERIDQLYYKGRKLELKDFKLITAWPTGYPSDHGLMIARFGLK